VISHSVSKCQSDENGEFAIFFSALGISKKRGPDQSSGPKTFSFGEKIAKIGPADPEIICLREIIKKRRRKKRKKLRKVKYI